MRKRKVSLSERKTSQSHRVVKFVGLSLGGGKSDKACLAILEYFPDNQKIFLTRIVEKIKSDDQISGDLKIHEIISQHQDSLHSVAMDTPWNLPLCMKCQLNCPGFESCNENHIQWMWKYNNEQLDKKRPKKLFTPYTQRAIEMYLASSLEEKFLIHHAMGANSAPLLARASFIVKRLAKKTNFLEVSTAISVFRLGSILGLLKSQYKDHRAAFGGDQVRSQFLQAIGDKNLTFIYNQDTKIMIENHHAFDAFICGYTAFLNYKSLTEKPPKGFPKYEDWIIFPKKDLKIKDL